MTVKVREPLGASYSPLEERRALQEVLAAFDLTLRGFDRKGGVILTDRGPHQLRRFPGTWQDLEFVAAALDYLEQRGFGALRPLVKTYDGEPGIRSGTGLYCVVRGESGRSLKAVRESELLQAARLLAGFHRAGEGLPPSAADRLRYAAWPEALQDRHADLQLMRREAVHSHGEFPRLFAEYADDFLEQADRAVTGLLAAPVEEVRRRCAERRQLAHRHFTPANVRRLGQEYIVDGWTHLALDLPVIDLARFLQRAGHDPERAYTFLSAYSDERPVSEPEWEIFLAWLRFPHAFWRLSHLHFARHETHRSQLAKVIRQEVEREVFIETLALQWAARQLVRVVPLPAAEARAAPEEAEPLDRTGENRTAEKEVDLVTREDELLGLGLLVEELSETEPVVVEVEPVAVEVEPIVEAEPVIAADPVIAAEPILEVEPVVETPVVVVEPDAPAPAAARVVVWRAFPPSLADSGR